MTNTALSAKDMLEHAWRYFSLHAQQRLSLFNYFLLASGSVVAGPAACLQRSGLFQILVPGSALFWS